MSSTASLTQATFTNENSPCKAFFQMSNEPIRGPIEMRIDEGYVHIRLVCVYANDAMYEWFQDGEEFVSNQYESDENELMSHDGSC